MDFNNNDYTLLEVRTSRFYFNWIRSVILSVFFTGLYIWLIKNILAKTSQYDFLFFFGMSLITFICFYYGIYGLYLHILSYLLDKHTVIKLDQQTGMVQYEYKNIRVVHFNVNDIIRCTNYCPIIGPTGYLEIELNKGQIIYISDYTDIQPILRMNPEIEKESRTPLILSYNKIRRTNA